MKCLTNLNMQYVFAYEMGGLIFYELDITSSPSPAKRCMSRISVCPGFI